MNIRSALTYKFALVEVGKKILYVSEVGTLTYIDKRLGCLFHYRALKK
jgi:hypothetical protein